MRPCSLKPSKLNAALSSVKYRTQASFLAIFGGDAAKAKKLDEIVTRKSGFQSVYSISSQTYTRKVDVDIANAFSSFAATCQHIGGDIRHLAMLKEMEEPFEKDQIGSSAMAYKRNPMRSERICSLGRHLSNQNKDPTDTYAAQWLERSLDDSAIRRINLPEIYLCADSLLILLNNVVSGLVVYPGIIQRHIHDELPFMATENIIMALVAKGKSRQDAHEHIRRLSHEAAAQVKQHGRDNDLIERLEGHEFFASIRDQLPKLMDAKSFVGLAPLQVEEFVVEGVEVRQALEKYSAYIANATAAELHV